MEKIDVARAWKDEDYRHSLSEAELAAMPANPAGNELSDGEIEEVFGGVAANKMTTFITICTVCFQACNPDTGAKDCPTGANCPTDMSNATQCGGTCAPVQTAGCCSLNQKCATVLSGTCQVAPVPVTGL